MESNPSGFGSGASSIGHNRHRSSTPHPTPSKKDIPEIPDVVVSFLQDLAGKVKVVGERYVLA